MNIPPQQQTKRKLLSRQMENMKIEAELSFHEHDLDSAVHKHVQIFKHLLTSAPENALIFFVFFHNHPPP